MIRFELFNFNNLQVLEVFLIRILVLFYRVDIRDLYNRSTVLEAVLGTTLSINFRYCKFLRAAVIDFILIMVSIFKGRRD